MKKLHRPVLASAGWAAILAAGVLLGVFLPLGLFLGMFLILFVFYIHPMVSVPLTVIAVMACGLLALLVLGKRRRKWFQRSALACGVVALICAGCVGWYAYEQSIPTVDERLWLNQWSPFREDPLAATLPEASTLTLTAEEALTLRIDGATSLYPVYASFVRNVFEPLEAQESWRDDAYYDRTLQCSGADRAYQRLLQGDADVIFCAAPSPEQEHAAADAGLTLHITPIGREALVFFVSSDNPVTGLTVKDVQAIYTGEVSNWKAMGGGNRSIRAYQREEDSDSQRAMQQMMAGLSLLPPSTELVQADMGTAIRQVAVYRNHRGAIGYTLRFFADEITDDGPIRLLALNGVKPTDEAIRDGSYPLAACFYAITVAPIGEPAPEEMSPVLGAFLDWCQEEQGQWIVEEVGYVSVE